MGLTVASQSDLFGRGGRSCSKCSDARWSLPWTTGKQYLSLVTLHAPNVVCCACPSTILCKVQVQSTSVANLQPQPNFRYPATVNYLAQLTGRDLHQQNSQPRSNLPVEQLDTSLQLRQPGFPQPHRGSPQPDVLTYPASSLAHFQQMLQAQAGNTQVLGPGMGDASGHPPEHSAGHSTGMLSQPMLQVLQQWQNPKPAMPSGKSNHDPNQSNQNPNIDGSQARLSPRYPSRGRLPHASASSPPSRAKTHDLQGAGSRGLLGASRGDRDRDQDHSEMEDDGQSTGSRLPSGKQCMRR